MIFKWIEFTPVTQKKIPKYVHSQDCDFMINLTTPVIVASFQAAVRYFTSNDLWQNAGALFPKQQTCKNDTYKLNGIIICKSVPTVQSNSSQLLQSYQPNQYEGKEQFPKTCDFSLM